MKESHYLLDNLEIIGSSIHHLNSIKVFLHFFQVCFSTLFMNFFEPFE